MSFVSKLFTFLCRYEKALAYLGALLVVLACWVIIFAGGDRVKSADEPDFLDIAQHLAFKGEYAEAGTLTAYRAPGLVFFMAPFVRAGAGLMEVRLANAVLVGLTLVLMFHLVRRHAPAPAGLFAVLMIPLWPVVVYSATTIYPQTLAAFLLVLTLALIDRLKPTAGAAIWPGLVYGGLILTVPIALLLTPLMMLWLTLRATRGWVQAGVFCLCAALVTCSWTARNYAAFDTFIPVATSSGVNLMAGNTPAARYDTGINVRFPEEVYTELTGADEVEKNKILTHAAIREITADPGRVFKLYIAKFLHWFDYSNTLLSDTVVEGGASSIGVDLRETILLVTYALVIAGPLLLRLLMIRRYPMRPIELVFVMLWVGAGLAYAIFFTRVRFRMPFDWLIISSNAIFLAALCETVLRKRGLWPR